MGTRDFMSCGVPGSGLGFMGEQGCAESGGGRGRETIRGFPLVEGSTNALREDHGSVGEEGVDSPV